MGFLVRTLPFYEQGPLFNAYNLLTNCTHPSNITIAGVGIRTLRCPSDPTMATKLNLSGPDPPGSANIGDDYGYVLPPGTWYQSQTNYCNVIGCVLPEVAPGANGIICNGTHHSCRVTDGTSNTLLLSEHAVGWFPAIGRQKLYWAPNVYLWNQAGHGAVIAQYAPDPWR